MVTRAALVCLALATISAAPALAQEPARKDDVRLEVIPETGGVDPYPGEMVLLRIRGVYRAQINIQKLIQPDLVNFGWMSLGRDQGFDAEWGGYSAVGFERRIAIFPEKPGPNEIGSFTHQLTVVDGVGYRVIDVKSEPITLNVARWQGPGGPNDPGVWWLPAQEVKVIDHWASDPNAVARGETVRRTVTIEARGVTAEQLPPPPVMRSPGIISFRGPNERETRVTQDGPISRAVYQWDMRPTTAAPAIVQAIRIPWFDTRARAMREAVIPAQRMAWAAATGGSAQGAAPPAEKASLAMTIGAGVLAFAIGLGVLLIGARPREGLPALPPRALLRMRLSAWRGDAAGFRAAVTELARHDAGRAEIWLVESGVRAGLAELDRHLFQAEPGPRPHLGRLRRALVAARRKAGSSASRPHESALAPLDGPLRAG